MKAWLYRLDLKTEYNQNSCAQVLWLSLLEQLLCALMGIQDYVYLSVNPFLLDIDLLCHLLV